MALNSGVGIVQNGLICHLDAANIRSYPGYFTTWFDLSETRNNVTLSGTTFITSNSGSINFDGVDNSAGFALNPSITNQITISLWIKPINNTGISWILGREGAYRMLYTSTLFIWDCSTVNNGWYTSGTSLISSSMSVYDKWRHVVGTYDGSNLRLYIDGILHATGANIIGNIVTVGNNLNLMKSFVAGLTSGKGSIGQIQFYNRALSAAEILQNYNATKQRYIYNQPINSSGLLLGLDFSDNLTYTGLGNTVFDLSPNVYKGTLTNGPKFTNDKNGGIIFDGVDDQINFSSNLVNYTYDNFSFEFVAKPSATITTSAESTSGIAGATGKRYIIEPTNEVSNGGFGVALGTNAVECIEHGGSYLPVLLSYSANLSDVNHYCVVVNNKQSKLYINGEYIKDGLQSPRPNSVARNTATLGFMYYGNYAGTLYEYNFYNRVLSANEIKSSFEINRGKYGIKNNRDKSSLLLDLDFSNRVCYPGTGNTAFDLSGNNYNGNLNSSPIFSRDQGGNFQFTGTPTITIPTSGPLILTKNDNYSLNFWVYANSTMTGGPSILEYTNINSYAFAIRFTMTNGTIEAKAYDGVNPINPSCDAVIEFNKWNHVCAVYNWSRNMIQLYLNGKIARILNLESYTFGTINNTSDIGIASRGNFSGRIGELKIYKRALSSSEINNYYLATKDRFFVDSQDIRDGLILDLDANNVDSYPGGNTWLDTSGSGTTARMIGNNYFIRGRSNNSFSLNGSDAYFTLGTVPNIDGYQLPLTLFGWFYMSTISGNQSVCGIYSASALYNYLRIDGGTFRFFLSIDGVLYPGINAGQYQYFDYSTPLVANNWYNFAIVIGGTLTSPTLTMYINNKPQTFSPVNLKSSVTLNQDYRIGANQLNSQFLAGFISQFKLFNRTLSASEINTLFQNTRSRYGI
jgi:hypothetical protein